MQLRVHFPLLQPSTVGSTDGRDRPKGNAGGPKRDAGEDTAQAVDVSTDSDVLEPQSPAGLAALIHEVTELRRAAEAKDLLVSASAAFDSSLDPLQTMRTVAGTAVPLLADMCVIDLVREDGTIGDSVAAAVEERLTRRIEELRTREPLDISGHIPSQARCDPRSPCRSTTSPIPPRSSGPLRARSTCASCATPATAPR